MKEEKIHWPTVAKERGALRNASRELPKGAAKDTIDAELEVLDVQASTFTMKDNFSEFKEQKREGFAGEVFTLNKQVTDLYNTINHLNAVRQGLLASIKESGSQSETITKMLDENLKEIQDAELALHNLEVSDESQDAYRAVQLLNMRKQAESGYVATEGTQSHKAFVNQQIDAQHPTLLEGPTGTGKTELLVSLVKERFGAEPEVLRCTERTGPAEIFGKTLLRAGPDGSTETYFQPGVLTRCLEKNIPLIMDEFNNMQKDMRFALKELYNRKEGQSIIIQEDSGRAIVVPSNFTFLATANLKSDKHKERFEFDDAETRVFASEHVGYMPEESQYDIALSSLMQKDGSLALSAYEASTVLKALVKTARETQDAYTGKSERTDPSSGEKAILESAVFDPGQLFKMVKGYTQVNNEKSFIEYLDESIVRFITKGNHSKDWSFLVQLFSKNGFLHGMQASDNVFEHTSVKDVNFIRDKNTIFKQREGSHTTLTIEQVAQLDPYELRRQRAQMQGESFLKSAPQVEQAESTVTLDDAIRVLGAENVIGPEDLKDVWGHQIDLPIPPSVTMQDLIKMKEMGHKLVLRYDKDNNGNPLTMGEMNKHYSSLGGKLLYDTDWYKNEPFFTSEISELGWYEVSSEPIEGTGDKNYFEQTKVLAQYIKKRFEGQKMQDEYMTAISDIEVLASGTGMEELINSDWKAAAEQLAGLQLNKLFRRSAPEVLQDFVNNFKKNGDRGTLESLYDWSNTRSSDGGLVDVGTADAGGAVVDGWHPGDTYGDLRAFFSRRL